MTPSVHNMSKWSTTHREDRSRSNENCARKNLSILLVKRLCERESRVSCAGGILFCKEMKIKYLLVKNG